MNKEINELDRMIVGVREWAVEETLRNEGFNGFGAEKMLEYAQKLEEFVLRGIPALPTRIEPDIRYFQGIKD